MALRIARRDRVPRLDGAIVLLPGGLGRRTSRARPGRARAPGRDVSMIVPGWNATRPPKQVLGRLIWRHPFSACAVPTHELSRPGRT